MLRGPPRAPASATTGPASARSPSDRATVAFTRRASSSRRLCALVSLGTITATSKGYRASGARIRGRSQRTRLRQCASAVLGRAVDGGWRLDSRRSSRSCPRTTSRARRALPRMRESGDARAPYRGHGLPDVSAPGAITRSGPRRKLRPRSNGTRPPRASRRSGRPEPTVLVKRPTDRRDRCRSTARPEVVKQSTKRKRSA